MRFLVVPLVLSLAAVSGCTSAARGYCDAAADCQTEIFGIEFDDAGDSPDSAAVCAATQEGILAALRANEEPRCQEAADAREAWYACIADEFSRNKNGCDAIGDECKSVREDFFDAQGNIDGDECSSTEN